MISHKQMLEEIAQIHAEDGDANSTVLAKRLNSTENQVMAVLKELAATNRIKTRELRGNDRTLVIWVVREF